MFAARRALVNPARSAFRAVNRAQRRHMSEEHEAVERKGLDKIIRTYLPESEHVSCGFMYLVRGRKNNTIQ
jgi:hypothetical protein